jgi:hypothetical protein
MSASLRDAPRQGRIRPILVALASGGLYGSWAVFANHGAGAAPALRAGATQAALSVIATLALVLVLEWLFRRPRTPVRGFWLASLGTAGLSAATVAAGHVLAGTPHIAITIVPSVTIATTSSFVYARLLLTRARSADPT